MKKYLVAGMMIASMNVFSQSYLILNNGITLTTDNAGFIYDFGHFRVPYKVTLNGGNFLVENQKLSTVDTAGFLYEKSLKVEKVKGKGLNYFINNDNELLTIDAKGFFYKYDKDAKSVFMKAIGYGGNFFIVKPDDKKNIIDLYTINSTGNYFKIDVAGLNPADIATIGGTFFQTKAGVVHTISKDGFVYAKPEVKVGEIKKAGGNFLIDSANLLFTVSEEGFLMIPVLPAKIKVADIQMIGSNYMLDSEGRIFIVDKEGKLVERKTNHDLRNTKIFSL